MAFAAAPRIRYLESLRRTLQKNDNRDERVRRHIGRLAGPILDRLAHRLAPRVAALQERVPTVATSAPAHDAGRDVAVAWGLKLYGSRVARELYDARIQPLLETSIALIVRRGA